MKKDDVKELLLRSLTDNISNKERGILQDNVLPDYEFSSEFNKKVMSQVSGKKILTLNRLDIIAGMDNAFLKIALTGAAAIILLTVSLFISQGSLSYDTLLGLDNSVDEGLISLLMK
jgi:hypothetical protein